MTERIIGPTGSKRRKRFLLVPILLIACTALFVIGSAQAVHDLQFQLDGNTDPAICPAASVPDCSVQTLDWNDLFNADGTNTGIFDPVNGPFKSGSFVRDFGVKTASDPCSLTATTGITGFCTKDTTTFATGSKDIQNITGGGAAQAGNWQCNKDNNVNSKIDIMNAYAAQYTEPVSGDLIIYFGLEKNKNNGDNNVAFWFLQGTSGCDASLGTANFSGSHQDGDVLVVSAFTSGGGVSGIDAYRWAGGSNGCIDSNDNPNPKTGGCNGLAIGSGGDCKSAPSTPPPAHPVDSICATTNSGTKPTNTNITTKWLTADSSLGVGHTVVPPDFFEGGIDITKEFAGHGGDVPSCFATFVGDTRSSQSLTATLFDFAAGQLGKCETTLSTQENASSPLSIGTGTVSSGTDTVTLTVTGSQVWGGTLTWYLCGPFDSPTLCDAHGVQVTSRTVNQSSPASDFVSGTANLTSAGRYCWHAHFEPDQASKDAGVDPGDDDGTNECFTVNPVTPGLTTQASCTHTPCVLGVDTISDTATLSGTASRPGNNGPGGDTGLYKSINATNGAAADNNISWTLYGPNNSSCTTNVKATFSRAVSGDGTYPTAAQSPVSYTPVLADGVGTYVFVASYPSDSVNTNAAPSTSCSDSAEAITLGGSASSSSAQRWLPNDRIVLNTTGGTTLTGSLTVTLYQGTFSGTAGACTAGSATAVSGQSYTFTPSGAASGSVFQTSNTDPASAGHTTFYVGTKPDGTAGGAAGTYFWLIHYVDNNLTSPTDRCETSTLSPITDG